MDKNIQATIDELKLVVLSLHRSAGQLDEIIQKTEAGIGGRDMAFDKFYVSSCREHRKNLKTTCGYDKLDKREDEIWERLIAYISEQCK